MFGVADQTGINTPPMQSGLTSISFMSEDQIVYSFYDIAVKSLSIIDTKGAYKLVQDT